MSRQAKRRTARVPSRSSGTRRTVVTILVGLTVAAGVLALVASSRRDFTDRSKRPEPPSGVESFTVESRNHTDEPVVYQQTPPVGGDHSPVWQDCAFYATPVGNEHAVHSLEHGAIWITYRPGLPKRDIDALRSLARSNSYVLASLWKEGLPAPVVATAWGRQLKLKSATDARLKQFVGALVQSPDSPEPGAACTGGIGA